MKTIFLVLFFAGLVVHSKGQREQDDAEDNDLDLQGEKRKYLPFSYEASSALADKLVKAVQKFRGDAARRARDMLLRLIKDWNKQTKKERKQRTRALKAVTDNIDAKADAHKVSTPAYIAVLNLMNTLKRLDSPNGHIVSLPAMFTSSFMFLIGESYGVPLDQIIYKEIKDVMAKYKEQDVVNSIKETSQTYSHLKKILNSKGRNIMKMSPHDANSTQKFLSGTYIHGFPAIVNLKTHMIKMIRNNKTVDAKKYLAYAELYVKLEIIRQMMITHLLSLFPESSPNIIKFTLSLLETSKKNSEHSLNVLHKSELQSKFMAYFDGEVYEVTNAYMSIQLGLNRPNVFPGLSCITRIGHNEPWKWFKVAGKNHPYFGKEAGTSDCKWRIVSHGQHLYSIVNKYDCPNGSWCGALLSLDINDNPVPVTIEHDDPMLWEIYYKWNLFPKPGNVIWPRQFCGNKCKCSLSYNRWKYFGQLDCSKYQQKVPQYWIIKSASSSDMVTDSDSSATNQSSENQEDNSVSGDMAVDPSADQDNEDNNFSDENESEIPEKIQPETTEQANQDSNGDEIED